MFMRDYVHYILWGGKNIPLEEFLAWLPGLELCRKERASRAWAFFSLCFLTVTVTWPTLSSHCLTCLPWLSPGIPPLSHFFLEFFFIQASQYVLILIPGYGATSQCPQQLTMIDLPRVLARVWFCQLQSFCDYETFGIIETFQRVYKC